MVRKKSGKNLTFSEIKQRIGEHLKTAQNVDQFTISFAVQEEDQWRVSINYYIKLGGVEWPKTATLRIDLKSGEIKEFKEGFAYVF